jgi:hypothetical protein
MNLHEFNEQIERLKLNYGDRAYPNPRVEILWRAFQKTPVGDFVEAVEECIAHQRQPPMFAELEKSIGEARARSAERIRRSNYGGSFAEVLDSAAKKSPNKEFAKACVDVVRKRTMGQLNSEQFEQACKYLEQAAHEMKGRK